VARGRDEADDETLVAVRCEGEFPMEVRGESHYQEAIRECVAGASAEVRSDDACSCEFAVRLVREPENPYDENAVAVRSLTDRTLGHLPRAAARDYAPVLDRLEGVALVECAARAYGRRDRPSDPWRFGIWLDLPDASEFAHAVEVGYETIRGTNGRQQDAIYGDGGTGQMVAVSCPACGAAAEAAPGVGGFRCRSCQNDVWVINCRRCHQPRTIYGSAVGSGALEFRCGNCRAKNTVAKQRLRAINAEVRRMERVAAASRRAAATAERQSLARQVEGRQAEAARRTGRVQAELAALSKLLSAPAEPFDFSQLKVAHAPPTFSPGALAEEEAGPVMESFLPEAPHGLAGLVPGAKRKYQEKVDAANRAFAEASAQHESREAERVEALNRARAEFDAKVADLDATTRQQHADVDQLEANFKDGDPAAVGEYYAALLSSIKQPYEEPDGEPRVAYSRDSHQLAIELELPPFDVVPEVREYKYIKSRDELKPVELPATERRRTYSSLIAQVALSVLRAAFSADHHAVVDTIVLNGHVHTTDKRTGQPIHPCLVTARATRERFDQLNLANVDPAACLRGLGASVSKSPAEMVPVRPVLDFNMVDPRFVATENILETLDTRPNLMELTPKEFEALITNLFEKMGLETRLTQPSRDGGVDCVAYDSRPIFGGKVVIQAKRYKNTVGVTAVRDLFGTMQNEGATKGILVTTSGYGQASHEFANGKPLELIDGGNLLYLLEQHADIEAKIVVPEDWVEPEPPA
jgi:restriction system protein